VFNLILQKENMEIKAYKKRGGTIVFALTPSGEIAQHFSKSMSVKVAKSEFRNKFKIIKN
jgi:hypothetical protein